jgi:hypothetical protein
VLILNPRTRRIVMATVIDRGPYGAVMPDGTWGLKRTSKDPGRYRGCIDLTPAASRMLGHNGFELVTYLALR